MWALQASKQTNFRKLAATGNSGIKTMKYIYQVVEANMNDEVVYAGDFYASREMAKDNINKQYHKAEKWSLHPWQSCKMPTGILSEEWTTYEIIKVAYNTKGYQRRLGIITHKLL